MADGGGLFGLGSDDSSGDGTDEGGGDDGGLFSGFSGFAIASIARLTPFGGIFITGSRIGAGTERAIEEEGTSFGAGIFGTVIGAAAGVALFGPIGGALGAEIFGGTIIGTVLGTTFGKIGAAILGSKLGREVGVGAINEFIDSTTENANEAVNSVAKQSLVGVLNSQAITKQQQETQKAKRGPGTEPTVAEKTDEIMQKVQGQLAQTIKKKSDKREQQKEKKEEEKEVKKEEEKEEKKKAKKLVITPSSGIVQAGGKLSFAVSGGSGEYEWVVDSDIESTITSQGSNGQQGSYQAGFRVSDPVKDFIVVNDGRQVTQAEVAVQPRARVTRRVKVKVPRVRTVAPVRRVGGVRRVGT